MAPAGDLYLLCLTKVIAKNVDGVGEKAQTADFPFAKDSFDFEPHFSMEVRSGL